MKCDYCKTENNKKANFCTTCGNPLNEVAKQHFPEMAKRGTQKTHNLKILQAEQ